MAERPTPSDLDLGQILEELSDHLEDPSVPATLAAVRVRLAAEPTPSTADRRLRRWRARAPRFALAGLAIVVVLSVALTVSPSARRAVADWLGIRGVLVEHQTRPPPTHLGGHLALGDPVSLADARRRVSFAILLPATPQLGMPDEVYVSDAPAGGEVSVVYHARPGFPAAAPSGVGLLITEFRAHIPDQVIRKVVGPDVRFEPVTVNGDPGYWFAGQPHQLTFADQNGRFFAANSRLAGNTLVWQHGFLTLRLESALTKDQAIRIAQALISQHRSPS